MARNDFILDGNNLTATPQPIHLVVDYSRHPTFVTLDDVILNEFDSWFSQAHPTLNYRNILNNREDKVRMEN